MIIHLIGLHSLVDGIINSWYMLLSFITVIFLCKEKKALAFNKDSCCHLALCLGLIILHWVSGNEHFQICVTTDLLDQNKYKLIESVNIGPYFC
jgi:hypothetical protein